MNWYLAALKKYSEFSGRARRQEYWMFVLFNLIFGAAATLIDEFLGYRGDYGILNSLYSLAMFIPGLAVSVRRLHDTGKSGWFLLIVLIPLIGWIWIIVVLATEGDKGVNKYGADPKDSNPDGFSSVLDGNI